VLRIARGHVPAVLLGLLFAIAHTWPLASAPASLSLNAHGDALLNEWILAWVAHQLPRDPLHLFDANIFHPAPGTLALSEPLIVPALLGAPLGWLGASPVLVYNLLLIAGFALTAAAGYVLVFAWTRDRAAALLAGSALAFNAHTLARLAHIQGIHLYGLPLALLAIDRLVERPRATSALSLALWMTVLAYTSGYLAVFGAIIVAIVTLVRIGSWRGHAGRLAAHLALAVAAAGAAVLPLYLEYRQAARDHGLGRTLEHVAQFSATPGGYLATAARVHQPWSASFMTDPGVNAFFAGTTIVVLAACALWLTAGDVRRRMWTMVALAAAGVALSLGTVTPIYGWIHAIFPPMQGLRVASRFGNLYLLAMAALAGLALASLRARTTNRTAAAVIAAAAIAAVHVEAAIAPVAYQRFGGIPRIYSLLASEPDPVVLAEIPAYPPQVIFENAPYVLASTAHWKKLVNGYSGYTPAQYRRLQPLLWHFPHPRALEAMRDAGVTYVMVHPARLGSDGEAVLVETERRPELQRVAIGPDGMRLYRLR
jgi:hypothetical protein